MQEVLKDFKGDGAVLRELKGALDREDAGVVLSLAGLRTYMQALTNKSKDKSQSVQLLTLKSLLLTLEAEQPDIFNAFQQQGVPFASILAPLTMEDLRLFCSQPEQALQQFAKTNFELALASALKKAAALELVLPASLREHLDLKHVLELARLLHKRKALTFTSPGATLEKLRAHLADPWGLMLSMINGITAEEASRTQHVHCLCKCCLSCLSVHASRLYCSQGPPCNILADQG